MSEIHLDTSHSVIEKIELTDFTSAGIELFIKRDDLIHPYISGNKWRKLKYNLVEAKKQGHHTLLTFGGAFSNHIAAVAAAGKVFTFNTIGIIRGEEVSNPTLDKATEDGMKLHFISRREYRQKDVPEYIQQLQQRFGEFYHTPEGGTNALALKGVHELHHEIRDPFDYIACAAGTGGTIAGLALNRHPAKFIGVNVLKGDFMEAEVRKWQPKGEIDIWNGYHFGGYAKFKQEFIDFIRYFHTETGVKLDPVYTGKLAFALADQARAGYFKEGSRILMVHTGGLQGIAGFESRFRTILFT